MTKIYCFEDTSQISKKSSYSFELPKYPESTTDPTYYEPTATRIANMRKSASSMKTLYDFEGDEAKSFIAENKEDESRVLKKIKETSVDPRFNSSLTREEVSQITNDFGEKVQKVVDEKKQKKKDRAQELVDVMTINNAIEKTTQNNNTSEE